MFVKEILCFVYSTLFDCVFLCMSHMRLEWIYTLYLLACQGTPSSKQVQYLKIKWLQRDSDPQALSSETNTQPFISFSSIFQKNCFSVWILWWFPLKILLLLKAGNFLKFTFIFIEQNYLRFRCILYKTVAAFTIKFCFFNSCLYRKLHLTFVKIKSIKVGLSLNFPNRLVVLLDT